MKNTYLQNIQYSKFHFWDVKRYINHLSLEFDNAVLLRDILFPFRKSVTKKELLKNGWTIISKINFHGLLFLREINEIQSYKGNLNLVPENSIIYSKINVRHGCVYFHKKGQEPFAVSSEYPTFTFDAEKVNGEFLRLVLRSEEFKRLLNTKTSGISKARVKVNEFLDIRIPLPSLVEQNRIFEAYNKKINQAEELEQKAKKLEEGIESFLSNELGIEKGKRKNKSFRLQTVSYKEINRWALSYLFKEQRFFMDNVKFSIVPLKTLITFFEGGKTPSTSRKDFWGGNVYWTSAKDMKSLFLDSVQDQITETAVKEAKLKVYPRGTILGVFRSGILRHSFPVTLTQMETAINQDLKAIGVNEEIVRKEYFLFYLKTFQKFILERAQKFGVTVESINTDEFLEIPVVLPPLPVQEGIVKSIRGRLNEINELLSKSASLKDSAIKEFENEIFMLD
ncbi:type I restriction enzyme, S subunit [Tangfeifania diversioriginum]|uniref:Type I restriction enzyme, S subunit n=1 Tax=Tangfeifania diversioriginum TaxID=1168035 RepID=A0A1M6L254_9BACT|nr:restriction endonuclease subunit S [Tangfeifania diversioriginum]SHJ65236.1 type I restriction enzyme, S subunit [Tangfeifania diversioriginum]